LSRPGIGLANDIIERDDRGTGDEISTIERTSGVHLMPPHQPKKRFSQRLQFKKPRDLLHWLGVGGKGVKHTAGPKANISVRPRV
jgi:hypothetical protein